MFLSAMLSYCRLGNKVCNEEKDLTMIYSDLRECTTSLLGS